jgi:hypothetical protein
VSLYAARKLIEQTFTLTAVNAAIDTLNTALSESAAHLAQVADGAFTAPDDLTVFPGLLLYVGVIDPAQTEVPVTGKRDFPAFPVALGVHTRVGDLATARRDLDIALEALLPLIDSLRGQEYLTNWGIIDVHAPALHVVPYVHEGATIRLDGIARFTMTVRRTGL